MLVRISDLLGPAVAAGSGVGAFNVISLEHAEAITAGAEAADLPVVLQVSQNCVRYHGRLEPILIATLAVARAASVPVAVHLDHVSDAGLIRAAVDLGCPSVMFDGSTLPYDENVEVTTQVVSECHDHGVDVEAELGEVGGKDGVHAPTARTRPEEAVSFVAATGVDALAVAVGSSHAMTDKTARLDLDLAARLHAAVPVPLVLHGSSGVPDDELVAAVGAGLTKINIGTWLNQVFTAAVRARLDEDARVVDPRKYLAPGRDAVAVEVERMLRLLG